MSDGYLRFAHSGPGTKICRALGLPIPPILRRADDSPASLVHDILLGSNQTPLLPSIETALEDSRTCRSADDGQSFDGLVFDGSGLIYSADLQQLYQFFNRYLSSLHNSGKIVLIGINPDTLDDPGYATVQRSLAGFIKALAKEVGRKGITANLIYAHADPASPAITLAAPLRFLLSYRSAYVDGQVITLKQQTPSTVQKVQNQAQALSWTQPLAGKTALVTGAARGIGAAIAKTLARDGARVIGLDIPQATNALQQTLLGIDGEVLAIDISDKKAPELIGRQIIQSVGAIDIVVHNAGITRDRTLSRMKPEQWTQVIDINLSSIERINAYLLDRQLINRGGRIIAVSSISGIAGNPGQTNYATSKAGVIGLIQSMAPQLAAQDITINGVAPGFIETEMTASIPFVTRQLGRRLCSLSQGGNPIDVAETIAFFAAPQARGVSGNLIRVCGQNLIGA